MTYNGDRLNTKSSAFQLLIFTDCNMCIYRFPYRFILKTPNAKIIFLCVRGKLGLYSCCCAILRNINTPTSLTKLSSCLLSFRKSSQSFPRKVCLASDGKGILTFRTGSYKSYLDESVSQTEVRAVTSQYKPTRAAFTQSLFTIMNV